jgi:hypothetical protein
MLEAMAKRSEAAKLQQNMRMQNDDLIFERDAADIALKEFMDNPDLDTGATYNINKLREFAKSEYQALQNEIMEGNAYQKIKANLPSFYSAYATKYGISASEIARAIETGDDNSIINKIANRLIEGTGVLNWRDMRDEEGNLTEKGQAMRKRLYNAATTYANQAIGKTEHKELYDSFGAEIAKMRYQKALEGSGDDGDEDNYLLDRDPAQLSVSGTDGDMRNAELKAMGLDSNGKARQLSEADFMTYAGRVQKSGKYGSNKSLKFVGYGGEGSITPGLGVWSPENYKKLENKRLQNAAGKNGGGSIGNRLKNPLTWAGSTVGGEWDSGSAEARKAFKQKPITLYNPSGTIKKKSEFTMQGADVYTRAVLSEYYDDAVKAIQNMRSDRGIKNTGKIGETIFPRTASLLKDVDSKKDFTRQSMTADVDRLTNMPEDNKKDIIKRAISSGDGIEVSSYTRNPNDAGDFEIKGKKVSSEGISSIIPRKSDGTYNFDAIEIYAKTKGNAQGFIIRNLDDNKQVWVSAKAIGGNVNTIFTAQNQRSQVTHQVRSDIKRVKDSYGFNDVQAIQWLTENVPEYKGLTPETLVDMDAIDQETATLWYTQLTATTSPDASNKRGVIKQQSRKDMLGD